MSDAKTVLEPIERLVSLEEALEISEELQDMRILDIPGGEVRSGTHKQYGKVRIFLTASNSGLLISST